MRTVSIFRCGSNQAICLPKDMEYEGVNELEIIRDGDAIILRPVFVNEVARFSHATFFSAGTTCGGFSQTASIGVQFRMSPDQRSGRARLASS